MCTLEKNNIPPLCIICTLMPQTIPLLTFMLVHMWYEESNPPPPAQFPLVSVEAWKFIFPK